MYAWEDRNVYPLSKVPCLSFVSIITVVIIPSQGPFSGSSVTARTHELACGLASAPSTGSPINYLSIVHKGSGWNHILAPLGKNLMHSNMLVKMLI